MHFVFLVVRSSTSMKQRKIIILKGLPASGKSTWAKEQVDSHPNVYKRINKDDIRMMLDNGKHSKGREAFVLRVRNMLIGAALNENFSVIVDDTNLNPIHESEIKELFESSVVKVETRFFNTKVDVCIARDAKRTNSVGKEVIMDMYKRWLKPQHEPVSRLNQDKSLPKAIICDIDGTLAILGERSPYDGSKVHLDTLDETIKRILERYCDTHKIILMSGRSSEFAAATLDWLKLHSIPFHRLWMRHQGDGRRDSIVKEELFDNHVRDQYFIEFVLDDRNQVVEMWRSLGLTCLQVADGDF